MHLKTINVNTAFYHLVNLFSGATKYERNSDQMTDEGRVAFAKSSSRNGQVCYIQEPVTITYEKPLQRVLFNQARDCNPFGHLFESLWMLAGRNDVEPLVKYIPKFAEYSDDRTTLNGSYGYRWRQNSVYDETKDDSDGPDMFREVDQLKVLIEHLKKTPESRRSVLQMWNVKDDLLKMDSSKDICCNLSVMFSIRGVDEPLSREPCSDVIYTRRYLDMTVTNRSNDLILGCLGANVVHFSFLQEYMAACLGVEVGVYNQFTNNLHVYYWNWKPEEWLGDRTPGVYNSRCIHVPLVKDPETFDKECREFIDNTDWSRNWNEPFLQTVAAPMMWAFELHKKRQYTNALRAVNDIKADDWRLACMNWVEKRRNNWEKKNASQD